MKPHTAQPAAYPDRKIASLESLRGMAALFVVIHHVPSWNAAVHDHRFMRNGYLLVDLFFVLSGFVIYSAYTDKIRSVRELVRFQFLRFGRLYPVHVLFLAVFVAIEASKYVAQARYGLAMPNSAPFRESGWSAFWEHVFLLQAIGPTGNALTFNSAAWSISVEFYTYLIFALTILLAPRFKHAMFIVFTAITVVLLVTKTTLGSTDFIRCIAGFFTGCLTAEIARRATLRLHPAVSSVAFVALLLFLAFDADSRLNSLTYPLTAVLILSLVASPNGWLNRLLECHPLTWLGTISYSIYMSHTAVIWAVNQVLRVALKRPVLFLDERMTPQLPVGASIACYALVVVCVLIVSALTYRFVEDPWRRKSRAMGFPGHFEYRR